jgi:hypothetical protein
MSELDVRGKQPEPSPRRPREAPFPMRIWGYDRDSVEAHLGELEQELERLEAARNAAAAGPELVGVGERVEAILAAAREAAANATGQAAEQAAKLTRESDQAAEQLRKEADEYATTKRKEADAYEASSRTETQRKVEELRQRATAEAEAATAAAEEEAEEILREAHLERGRIEDSIAELRERRQQVIASIERLKGSLGSMVGEAEQGTAQFLAPAAAASEEAVEAETELADAESETDTEADLEPETESGVEAEAELADADTDLDDADTETDLDDADTETRLDEAGTSEVEDDEPFPTEEETLVFEDDTDEQAVRAEDL